MQVAVILGGLWLASKVFASNERKQQRSRRIKVSEPYRARAQVEEIDPELDLAEEEPEERSTRAIAKKPAKKPVKKVRVVEPEDESDEEQIPEDVLAAIHGGALDDESDQSSEEFEDDASDIDEDVIFGHEHRVQPVGNPAPPASAATKKEADAAIEQAIAQSAVSAAEPQPE